MIRFLLQRLAAAIPTLLALSIAVFLMIRLIPGDPAVLMAGPQADPALVENIRRQLGTDQPLPIQYLTFLGNALHGDLGRSFTINESVTSAIGRRLPVTLIIAALAMALAAPLGILLGIVAARNQNGPIDLAASGLAAFLISIPAFWLGLMLIYVFTIQLRLVPSIGLATPAHAVLPIVVYSLFPAALIARMTRSSMVEVLRQDYVRTARAMGITERAIDRGHALKNAMIPVITIIGVGLGIMIGSSVLIETIFSIDGLGRLMVSAILARDFPVVQASILLLGVIFIAINIMLDVAIAYLDPRVRLG